MEYYENLLEEEKRELTDVIRTLNQQTFLLERRYDKKTDRYQLNKKYRICERHYDFLREYFQIAGMDVIENRQYGIFSLQSDQLIGDKLSKLTTIFLLLCKLIYEEQMNTASNSIHVYTTLNELFNKISLFRLWSNKNVPITEVRKSLALLKKYQIIEVLDDMGELEGDLRIMIYPTIHVVIPAQGVQGMIEQYQEEEEDEKLSGDDAGMSEQLALY